MARSTAKQERASKPAVKKEGILEDSQWIRNLREQIMFLQEQAGKQYGVYYVPTAKEKKEAPGNVEATWKINAKWRNKTKLHITPRIWQNLDKLDRKLKTEPTITDVGKAQKILKKYLYPAADYAQGRRRKDYYSRRTEDRQFGENIYYGNFRYDLPFDERYEIKQDDQRRLDTEQREMRERQWPEGTFPQAVPRSKDPLGRRFAPFGSPTPKKARGGKIKRKYARGGGIRKPKGF
jgi:hypothetical protein